MEKIFLANIDHIISVKVTGQKDHYAYRYITEHHEMVRVGFFKIRKENQLIPGCYRGEYGNTIPAEELKEFIKRKDDDRLGIIGRKHPFNVVWRPMVKLILVGGKYTGEQRIMFDEFEDAKKYAMDLHEKHPNKFALIINEDE